MTKTFVDTEQVGRVVARTKDLLKETMAISPDAPEAEFLRQKESYALTAEFFDIFADIAYSVAETEMLVKENHKMLVDLCEKNGILVP